MDVFAAIAARDMDDKKVKWKKLTDVKKGISRS